MRAAAADTPVSLGFRMPAEWEPHAATWISWPFDDALWEGYLEPVRAEFARLVATIASFEPVWLNVRDEEARSDALRRLRDLGAPEERLRFNEVPLDDAWFRDNGPIFVVDGRGNTALTDWRFNSWGEKYPPWDQDDAAPKSVEARLGVRRFEVPIVLEGGAIEVNSEGVCLTTRSCLLSQRRNPNMTQDEYEQVLHEQLGIRHVVWLDGGMRDDHTDGHIDTIVRFCDDRTIVCLVEEDEDDVDHPALANNLHALQNLRDGEGRPYEVLPLPAPRRKRDLWGRRLPQTYANFYIGNGFVVVPTYGDENDEVALDLLRERFPGREVLGLSAQAMITGGGAFHCVTQQQPAAKEEE